MPREEFGQWIWAFAGERRSEIESGHTSRSSEWVEVTDRPREAKSGEALTVRVVRQSRNAGPRVVTKRKLVRQCLWEEPFRTGADARVPIALLHKIYIWGEVQVCKITMVLFCGVVVCASCVNFWIKWAEVYFSVIYLDSGFPHSLSFVPFEAFVYWARFWFFLWSVAEVLRNGCRSEVFFSIVEAVAVYVVTEKVSGDVNDLPVHPNSFSGVFSSATLPADGVWAGRAFGKMPFVLCEAGVVFGINDSEFASGERDP